MQIHRVFLNNIYYSLRENPLVVIIGNLTNAETINDGCGVNIAECMNLETCYVCNSFVRWEGDLCHEFIGYVLIGLKWNCSLCCTFSDNKCFDHAPIAPHAPVVVRNNPNHDLRDVDRVNYNESSEDDDDIVVVFADVGDGTMDEGNDDVDDETMDEGNEENLNRVDLVNNRDEDSASEDGLVRFRIIENMNDGPFDYRDYDSESDHDSDTRYRICFAQNDPDYHDIVEERENGNWSAPYCRDCNGNRNNPRSIFCCVMWHDDECCMQHD